MRHYVEWYLERFTQLQWAPERLMHVTEYYRLVEKHSSNIYTSLKIQEIQRREHD